MKYLKCDTSVIYLQVRFIRFKLKIHNITRYINIRLISYTDHLHDLFICIEIKAKTNRSYKFV